MSTADRQRRQQILEFGRLLSASNTRRGRFLDVKEILRSHDNNNKKKRKREDDLNMTTATTMKKKKEKKKAAKTTSFLSLSSVVTDEPLEKSQHALSKDDHNNKRRRQDEPKTATATKKNKKTANAMPFSSLSSLVSDEPLSKAQHAKPTSLKKKKKKKNEREEVRASILAVEEDAKLNMDDNFKTMNELKSLCGGHEVLMGSSFAINSWELGLCLKKDYGNDDDDDLVGVSYCHEPVKLLPLLLPPPPPPTAEALSLKETISRAKDAVLKRKREAARASLLAMEKEVDIDDNFKTMNDFKKLIGGRELVMGLF